MWKKKKNNQTTLEMTTEIRKTEEEEEGQDSGVIESLPEAVQLLHWYEITVGKSFTDSVALDDSLPLERSKPVITIVVQGGRGNEGKCMM